MLAGDELVLEIDRKCDALALAFRTTYTVLKLANARGVGIESMPLRALNES